MTAARKDPYKMLPIGIACSLVLSIALVALCALLIQKQTIGFSAVPIINPLIKSVCALVSALIGTGRFDKRSWLYGAGCGLAYIVTATLVFSLLSGGISLSLSNLTDAAMCAFSGMIGGIIRSLSK